MKKSAILEALPRRREIEKTVKATRKQIAKLEAEAAKQEILLDEIEGVIIHNGEPVRLVESTSDVFAFEPVTGKNERYTEGFLKDAGWIVNGDNDTNLGIYAKRSAAETAAKNYVLTGKVESPTTDAPAKKRGRPRKPTA